MRARICQFASSSSSILAWTLLAVGCSATGGYIDVGTADASTIHGAQRSLVMMSPNPVVIRMMDGKSVSSSSVRVSPGRHVLRVTCYESLFSRNTHDLDIDVEAGQTYTLTATVDPDKISDGTEDCRATMVKDSVRNSVNSGSTAQN